MSRLSGGVLQVAGWTGLAVVVLETVARQLTRTRPIGLLPESPAALALLALVAMALALIGRRLRRTGTATAPGHRGATTAIVFAGLLAAGLSMQLQFGARLQSDAFYYFAYLRSIAFDGDVNFLNDYRLLGQTDKPHLFEPTSTGHAHSAWTIGPAIVWSPFFAAGHVAATRLAASGREVATDGTSYPYRQAICIAGLCYALLGTWFTLRLTRRFFPTDTAAIATAAGLGGSFMLWYALVEPTMTHAPSMAAVAGFAWYWVTTMGRRTVGGWVLLGAIAGLAGLIRWQNVLFALLPACEALMLIAHARRTRDWPAGRTVLVAGAAFAAAAMLAFVPQMLAWKAIYGSYLAVSPVGPTIDLLDAHLVDVLFSSRNGLFATSPVLYLGAIGLIVFAWWFPSTGVPVLVAAAAMTWFNASIYDWWGSDGYGGRRFDGLVPLLVPGLAAAFVTLREIVARRPRLVVGAALAAAAVWNLTLMSAAHRGVLRLGEATAFRDVGSDQARTAHAWFGHPFSYPVNLLYAVRHGVSPGDYDLLSPYRFLGDRARPYGQIDVGGGDEIYLRSGWHAAERDGDRTFRWASRTAEVLVPLDRAAPLDVHLRLRAYAPSGAPPQQVTVLVNGRHAGAVPVPPDWDTVIIQTPASIWRGGVSRLRLEFAWASRPVDLGDGGDTRELAAAVDNIRVGLREGGGS